MGNFTYTSNLAACLQAIEDTTTRNVERACINLTNKTKMRLTGQRTGRLYRVAGTKNRLRKYQASAPGEPPAVRTGRLRNSMRYIILHKGSGVVQGIVGTSSQYALPLEMGTSKMRPRPFLRPTFEAERGRTKWLLEGGG